MTTSDDKPTGYRSGIAARLAGLSVETLRVWERRYNVSEADRSAHGQRLYTADQVRRLGLLKRVVDQGHAISTVARLQADELIALAGTTTDAARLSAPVRTMQLAVAGAALSRRLAAIRTSPSLQIVATCAQLDGAADVLAGVNADVLLIESTEMSSDALPLVLAAKRAAQARAVVVLYRFCDSATVRRLREHGCLVARAPSDMAEVALLCGTALAAAALPAQSMPAPPPRRIDDQVLAALAGAATSINCECPRHLAEILSMLCSFERYSLQCAHRNASDAALHLDLHRSAGQARALVEQALERLAYAEGLPLAV